MDRLFPYRWKHTTTIRMAFVDNGVCPFDVALAGAWLDHLCDLLQFLTNRPFEYAGIVTEDTGEDGVIYHQYVPTGTGSYWAQATRRTDGHEIIGGACKYRADEMALPEHFAGICLHEVKHVLGVKHFNTHRSVMNNGPYNGYPEQACPMAADYFTLMMLFGGPMRPLWPSAYDYGDLSQGKCLIHVPSIMWQPGSYAALWLNGTKDDGEWILEAPGHAIHHHASYVGSPVASLRDDVLHIPLRHRGSTLEVIAPLTHFTGPSSKVQFEVSDIRPLHIQSAGVWPG